MKRRAIGVLLLLLAVIGAALSWRYFRLSVLTPTELKSTQPNPKPPPEPVKFEENYSEARSKPCDRSETAISTTICDVIRVPEVFAGKCIRVPGRFLSDGLEHSVIIDESCSKMGLSPWATEKVTRRLDAAIWQPGKGVPGTPSTRKITAQFTGRFVWRPQAKSDVRVMEINAVTNLKSDEHPPM